MLPWGTPFRFGVVLGSWLWIAADRILTSRAQRIRDWSEIGRFGRSQVLLGSLHSCQAQPDRRADLSGAA